MKNNNCSKIVKAKKASLKTFLTGLAGVVALTSVISLSGCSFNTSTNNPNSGYEVEIETEHNHEHDHEHEHNHEDVEEPIVETPEVEEVEPEEEVEETITETETEEVEEERVETPANYENYDFESVVIRNYEGISIVEALRSNGYDYSFKFRKALAAYLGIENYRGTAEQNIQLLNILINKGLENPVPSVPVQPVQPTPGNTNPTPDPTPEIPEEPERHEHSWSDWISLNDQKELRTCSCGARQTRNHSYGAWEANGNGTESRTCDTCGHTQTRDIAHTHNWSDWSAFDDSQEVRSCSCGENEYRSHSYGAWSNNGNNTESRTCGTCGHTQTRDIAHTHNWGAWEYLNDSLEQRECSCGQTETREHSLGTANVEYVNNNDGTHTIITTKHCSTCNHDISTERTESCDLGEWTYNSTTGLDERVCGYCGYTETREHIHTDAPDNLVYGNAIQNNDGTHRLTATYTCTSCNQTVTLTINEDCEYGAWSDAGSSHYHECEICGYGEYKAHYPDASGIIISDNALEDYHTESYVCGDCGLTISSTVACTSDNSTHYEEINGVTVEYSICTECGEHTNERSHTHSYGDWSYQDENNEVRSCGCGYGTETRSHNYGEWTYDAVSGQLIQTCSGCGHTRTKAHTHTYGNLVKEDSSDPNVCYVEVTSCECGDEVRTPIAHDTYETVLGGITYQYCYNCNDYEQIISNTQGQTFNLSRPLITEEEYDEIVNEVLNEITEEEIIEEEIIEDEIIEDEVVEEEIEEEIEEEQLPDKTVEEVIEEDIYKEEEGEKDLENNEEDTKSLSLIP